MRLIYNPDQKLIKTRKITLFDRYHTIWIPAVGNQMLFMQIIHIFTKYPTNIYTLQCLPIVMKLTGA
jgi:hypothetical protein